MVGKVLPSHQTKIDRKQLDLKEYLMSDSHMDRHE